MSINQKIQNLLIENYSFIRQDAFQTKPKNAPPMAPRLVCDGIVDEDKYSGIVFLLKESTEKGINTLKPAEKESDLFKINDFPDDPMAWDFISTTKKRAGAQGVVPTNWEALCYWTEAIKNSGKTYQEAVDCGKNLLEVALINIKKTTGEGTSKNAPLMPIACHTRYAEIIRKQLEDINSHPQKIKVVVCCGTFAFAEELYGTTGISTKSGAKYLKNQDGVVFVDFLHPTQYGAAANIWITYAYLKEILGVLRAERILE